MRRTCLNMVYELAKADERIVFIGSDLGPGVLENMKTEMPERFFMEGVSEANVIGMAAGLARDGFIPYVNTIATFLARRALEQISMDLCLHNLPVRLIANGGGLVYAPLGPTHMAVDDIALMRSQPNMTVVSPSDAVEMTHLMKESVDWTGPIYIRLGKGGDPIIHQDEYGFEIGKATKMRSGKNVLIVSSGVMTNRALEASNELHDRGVDCTVLHVHTIKPFDQKAFFEAIDEHELIVTLDEHFISGGLGSVVLEAIADSWEISAPKVLRIGIPDAFSSGYGSQDSQMEQLGLQPPQIADVISAKLSDRHVA